MHTRSHTRRVAGALVAALFAVTTAVPAEARIGKSRGSTPSRSYSAPARAPAQAAPSVRRDSGRLGGGASMGMQRSDVTQRARAQRAPQPGTPGYGGPTAGAAAGGAVAGGGLASRGVPPGVPPGGYGVPPGGYGAQLPAQQGRGGSWVGPAVAGAAIGAAAGYALGNRNEQQPAGTNGAGAGTGTQSPADATAAGGGTGSSGGASASSLDPGAGTGAGSGGATGAFPDTASAAPTRAPGMGPMGFGLIALLLAGLGWMMLRRRSAQRAVPAGHARTSHAPGAGAGAGATPITGRRPSDAVESDEAAAQALSGMAATFYTQLQDLNNRGDLAGLRARTTDDIFPALAADIQQRERPSQTSVVSVEPQLLDLTREPTRLVGSVRFRSVVSESPNEPPQRVDEVWHFVRDTSPGAAWRLAGIEQV